MVDCRWLLLVACCSLFVARGWLFVVCVVCRSSFDGRLLLRVVSRGCSCRYSCLIVVCCP